MVVREIVDYMSVRVEGVIIRRAYVKGQDQGDNSCGWAQSKETSYILNLFPP